MRLGSSSSWLLALKLCYRNRVPSLHSGSSEEMQAQDRGGHDRAVFSGLSCQQPGYQERKQPDEAGPLLVTLSTISVYFSVENLWGDSIAFSITFWQASFSLSSQFFRIWPSILLGGSLPQKAQDTGDRPATNMLKEPRNGPFLRLVFVIHHLFALRSNLTTSTAQGDCCEAKTLWTDRWLRSPRFALSLSLSLSC